VNYITNVIALDKFRLVLYYRQKAQEHISRKTFHKKNVCLKS